MLRQVEATKTGMPSGKKTGLPEGYAAWGESQRRRQSFEKDDKVQESTGPGARPVSSPEDSEERKRRERRRYLNSRAQRTAVQGGAGKKKSARRPWGIDEARTALNVKLTVPEAAVKINRTASAVEELRKRWRAGRLPASLADQIPPPPSPAAGQD